MSARMRPLRWVRTHPYTTATPFIMAAVAAVFHFLTGAAWWKSVLFVLAMCAIACFNVWQKQKGRQS